jgi:hypothetical protein
MNAYSAPVEAQSCPPARTLSDGDRIELPQGYKTFDGLKAADGGPAPVTLLVGDKINAAQADQINKLHGVYLQFSNGPQICKQAVASAAVGRAGEGKGGNPPLASNAGHTAAPADCRKAGEAWATDVALQTKSYTMIVFTESGDVCYANRLYGVAGDPIYIGLWTNVSDPVSWKPIQFTPCSLEDAAPAIFVSADSVSVRPQAQAGDHWDLMRGQPRQCFNDSVGISAATQSNNQAVAFTLLQYRQYRATLQLGVLFTPQHTSSFGLATNSAGASVIHDSASHGNGPEYVASLVVYGLPHYLHTLVGGPVYRGRDLLHDDSLWDRLGLVTGIGLSEPSRRYVVGVSFEIMYGFNVVFAEELHRQTVLEAGVDSGAPFLGTADAIPKHDQWNHEVVVGISLDLRYVQELFSGRIHQ